MQEIVESSIGLIYIHLFSWSCNLHCNTCENHTVYTVVPIRINYIMSEALLHTGPVNSINLKCQLILSTCQNKVDKSNVHLCNYLTKYKCLQCRHTSFILILHVQTLVATGPAQKKIVGEAGVLGRKAFPIRLNADYTNH